MVMFKVTICDLKNKDRNMADNIEHQDKGELVTNCDRLQNDEVVVTTPVESRIMSIREKQIMIDRDLAELYGVETKRLNEAVKRNIERFPERFRFQLTKEEMAELVANCDRFNSLKHSTVRSYAFTEQGVAMLSTVLRSETAIRVSIRIMDAFVAMRRFMVTNAEVFQRLSTMEYHQLEIQQHQQETDKRIEEVFRRLDEGNAKPKQGVFYRTIFWKGTKQKLVMRFCAILILSVISILNSLELKSQTVVNILSNGYKLERSLFLHGKKIGVYNKKGRLIKLSTDDKTRQKIFLNQSNSLTDYGIKLKYPEVIHKDACVIADILSSYDPSEILSFTKPIGEQKKISIQNINKYYTYLDASVDYVLSIEIIVKDCLITQYSYTYKPNMSDVIISYTCVFTYDKNNRVVKLKKEYRKHYETIEFIYETK